MWPWAGMVVVGLGTGFCWAPCYGSDGVTPQQGVGRLQVLTLCGTRESLREPSSPRFQGERKVCVWRAPGSFARGLFKSLSSEKGCREGASDWEGPSRRSPCIFCQTWQRAPRSPHRQGPPASAACANRIPQPAAYTVEARGGGPAPRLGRPRQREGATERVCACECARMCTRVCRE